MDKSIPARRFGITDAFARPLRNLRLSVTDRCNLRCAYCMPQEEYSWLPREDLLTWGEISTLVDVFTTLGVEKVRLTGGEPLLRSDIASLIRLLVRNPHIQDLALTTNGVMLAEQVQELHDAGLHRITVSLDTLKPDRFRALTRRDMHGKVLAGIGAVSQAKFKDLKLDTVVIRGVNDDELVDLIEYGKQVRAEVRFIEYMDVGGATSWTMDKVCSRAGILTILSKHYGPIEPIVEGSWAPAERFRLTDGTVLGIIASTTAPFCSTCDRSRLTADGMWYLCLYACEGIDLRQPLRAGASREELASIISSGWHARRDRGAEERKALEAEGMRNTTLIPLTRLRTDPHLEMHTRGG